jgi:hypothetical protein
MQLVPLELTAFEQDAETTLPAKLFDETFAKETTNTDTEYGGRWRRQRSWFTGAPPESAQEPTAKALFLFICLNNKQQFASLAHLAFMIMISMGGLARLRYTDKDFKDEWAIDCSEDDESDELEEEESLSTEQGERSSPVAGRFATPVGLKLACNGPLMQTTLMDTRLAKAYTQAFLSDLASSRFLSPNTPPNYQDFINTTEVSSMKESKIKRFFRKFTREKFKSRVVRRKKRLTIRIVMKDSLNVLAEKIFHDANIGWLIADVNRGGIREDWMDGKRIVRLKETQEIVLPNWGQIINFYETRPSIARAGNLVTIVETVRVDRKRINEVLGPILGNAFKKPPDEPNL